MDIEIKHFKVRSLPSQLLPNAVYYVKDPLIDRVIGYITSNSAEPFKFIDLVGPDIPTKLSQLFNDVGYITAEDLTATTRSLRSEINNIKDLTIGIVKLNSDGEIDPDLIPFGAGDKTFTHQQSTVSAVWTINHPLKKNPAVAITDTAGSIVEGSIKYINKDQLQITFSAPFSGYAELN